MKNFFSRRRTESRRGGLPVESEEQQHPPSSQPPQNPHPTHSAPHAPVSSQHQHQYNSASAAAPAASTSKSHAYATLPAGASSASQPPPGANAQTYSHYTGRSAATRVPDSYASLGRHGRPATTTPFSPPPPAQATFSNYNTTAGPPPTDSHPVASTSRPPIPPPEMWVPPPKAPSHASRYRESDKERSRYPENKESSKDRLDKYDRDDRYRKRDERDNQRVRERDPRRDRPPDPTDNRTTDPEREARREARRREKELQRQREAAPAAAPPPPREPERTRPPSINPGHRDARREREAEAALRHRERMAEPSSRRDREREERKADRYYEREQAERNPGPAMPRRETEEERRERKDRERAERHRERERLREKERERERERDRARAAANPPDAIPRSATVPPPQEPPPARVVHDDRGNHQLSGRPPDPPPEGANSQQDPLSRAAHSRAPPQRPYGTARQPSVAYPPPNAFSPQNSVPGIHNGDPRGVPAPSALRSMQPASQAPPYPTDSRQLPTSAPPLSNSRHTSQQPPDSRGLFSPPPQTAAVPAVQSRAPPEPPSSAPPLLNPRQASQPPDPRLLFSPPPHNAAVPAVQGRTPPEPPSSAPSLSNPRHTSLQPPDPRSPLNPSSQPLAQSSAQGRAPPAPGAEHRGTAAPPKMAPSHSKESTRHRRMPTYPLDSTGYNGHSDSDPERARQRREKEKAQTDPRNGYSKTLRHRPPAPEEDSPPLMIRPFMFKAPTAVTANDDLDKWATGRPPDPAPMRSESTPPQAEPPRRIPPEHTPMSPSHPPPAPTPAPRAQEERKPVEEPARPPGPYAHRYQVPATKTRDEKHRDRRRTEEHHSSRHRTRDIPDSSYRATHGSTPGPTMQSTPGMSSVDHPVSARDVLSPPPKISPSKTSSRPPEDQGRGGDAQLTSSSRHPREPSGNTNQRRREDESRQPAPHIAQSRSQEAPARPDQSGLLGVPAQNLPTQLNGAEHSPSKHSASTMTPVQTTPQSLARNSPAAALAAVPGLANSSPSRYHTDSEQENTRDVGRSDKLPRVSSKEAQFSRHLGSSQAEPSHPNSRSHHSRRTENASHHERSQSEQLVAPHLTASSSNQNTSNGPKPSAPQGIFIPPNPEDISSARLPQPTRESTEPKVTKVTFAEGTIGQKPDRPPVKMFAQSPAPPPPISQETRDEYFGNTSLSQTLLSGAQDTRYPVHGTMPQYGSANPSAAAVPFIPEPPSVSRGQQDASIPRSMSTQPAAAAAAAVSFVPEPQPTTRVHQGAAIPRSMSTQPAAAAAVPFVPEPPIVTRVQQGASIPRSMSTQPVAASGPIQPSSSHHSYKKSSPQFNPEPEQPPPQPQYNSRSKPSPPKEYSPHFTMPEKRDSPSRAPQTSQPLAPSDGLEQEYGILWRPPTASAPRTRPPEPVAANGPDHTKPPLSSLLMAPRIEVTLSAEPQQPSATANEKSEAIPPSPVNQLASNETHGYQMARAAATAKALGGKRTSFSAQPAQPMTRSKSEDTPTPTRNEQFLPPNLMSSEPHGHTPPSQQPPRVIRPDLTPPNAPNDKVPAASAAGPTQHPAYSTQQAQPQAHSYKPSAERRQPNPPLNHSPAADPAHPSRPAGLNSGAPDHSGPQPSTDPSQFMARPVTVSRNVSQTSSRESVLHTPSSLAPSLAPVALLKPTTSRTSVETQTEKKRTGLFGFLKSKNPPLTQPAATPAYEVWHPSAESSKQSVKDGSSEDAPVNPAGSKSSLATRARVPPPVKVPIPIQSTPASRQHPVETVFTPFKYLTTKRRRTPSSASVDAQDGTAAANTTLGSPTVSMSSQAPPIFVPPLRDAQAAARDWIVKEEVTTRDRAQKGKLRRHRPGVVIEAAGDPSTDKNSRAYRSRPASHQRQRELQAIEGH